MLDCPSPCKCTQHTQPRCACQKHRRQGQEQSTECRPGRCLTAAWCPLQLALGRPPNPALPQEGRASAAAVLAALRAHPSLREVVLLGNFDGCCDPAMLEVVLGLRGCKPGLSVRAVGRSHYFVEDPAEEEEEVGRQGQQGEGGPQGEVAAGV